MRVVKDSEKVLMLELGLVYSHVVGSATPYHYAVVIEEFRFLSGAERCVVTAWCG